MIKNRISDRDLSIAYRLAYAYRHPKRVHYDVKASLYAEAAENMDIHYLALKINKEKHSKIKAKKHD